MEKTPAGIKSHKEFKKTPAGWARYWATEVGAARKAFEKWHKGCETIVKEFLDERPEESNRDERRINYFWANISTKKALLYANDTPTVDVSRRFGDQDDDSARISGPLILKRVLDTDIEQGFDGTKVALRNALLDFLMFGFGMAWVRYEREEDGKRLVHEDVPVDYVHHDDYLHSPCRTFEEMRWAAKRVQMTQDELAERFGAELAMEVVLNATEEGKKDEAKDPWDRCEVWEIWSKEHRQTFWWVDGFDKTLDIKGDILGLRDFWPFPRPMMANVTTTAYMPRPDFALIQDLYRDINNLMSRINLLEQALRLAGVYDRTVGEITRLVDGSLVNELIPVENMGALAEKGGLDGVISWLSIKEVVETISALEDKLMKRQQLLYELTGMSELMQGAADPAMERESATKTRARVRFGNVRTQAAQDEFARFASDLQALKAEVMVKHYEPGTFLKRSNVLFTPDAPMALAAVKELKKEFPNYRIKIQSEALAAQDFAAIKAERGEFLTAFATIMRDAVPLLQMFPHAAPLVLETVKWALAGLRGSASIEGVFDRMLRETQKSLAQGGGQQKQDPEQMKTQMKLMADLKKDESKVQTEQAKAQIQIQAEAQRQDIQTRANVLETMMTERLKAQARREQEDSRAADKAVARATRPTPGGKK